MNSTLVTNDINKKSLAMFNQDARDPSLYIKESFSWIITNPPFSYAIDILQAAWNNSDARIAMLLRISFLEPVKARIGFLKDNSPDEMLVLPRISFTGDGKTDSCTCAWMIWHRGLSDKKGIKVIPK